MPCRPPEEVAVVRGLHRSHDASGLEVALSRVAAVVAVVPVRRGSRRAPIRARMKTTTATIAERAKDRELQRVQERHNVYKSVT